MASHNSQIEYNIFKLYLVFSCAFASVVVYLHGHYINVSVLCNDEFLLGIILLVLYYYHWGTRLYPMESFCPYITAYPAPLYR